MPSFSSHLQMTDETDLTSYLDTQVNLTAFRLIRGQSVFGNEVLNVHTWQHAATVYDSLLALHQAVKIYRKNTHQCQWTGQKQIDHILPKVLT